MKFTVISKGLQFYHLWVAIQIEKQLDTQNEMKLNLTSSLDYFSIQIAFCETQAPTFKQQWSNIMRMKSQNFMTHMIAEMDQTIECF